MLTDRSESDRCAVAAAGPSSGQPEQAERIAPLQSLDNPATRNGNGSHPLPTHGSPTGDIQAGPLLRARSNGASEPALRGRRHEAHAFARLLESVRAGCSRVLVLRGESGAGKSALLEYLVGTASECRVVRATGVEYESALPYAGLHLLCAPMLDLRDRLPAPQRDALATVFGLSAGAAPDPFLVGLATLTLFAAVSEEQPLVCIVDDAQWLDPASAQILGFVARRLLDERVAIVCATRTGLGDHVLGGLPELHIRGLDDGDACALLLDNVHGPLDAAVCDQIVTESHGNPLALLALPRTWNAAGLAGGFGLPGSVPVADNIEESYARRLAQLSSDTRLLVLAAAAEPLGDPVLLHRAAGTLGLHMAAANPAVDVGLLKVSGRVEFAHPLVRSAAYRTAAADDRQRVHRALAEATDAETDPDRRAWHRAHAAPGPDEHIAGELERSAGRAQARGGVAAAAAFLQRAVALTVEPARRAERALAAAHASMQAGAFDVALGLLVTAEAGPLDEFQRARADLVRAHVAFTSDLGSDAPAPLLKAARRLEPFDLELARATYLAASGAAGIAGHHAGAGVGLEICRAIQSLPPTDGKPRPLDLLLDGLTLLATDGHVAAASTLQRAADALTDIPIDDVLRWGWMATDASCLVWDVEGTREISARQVRLVRDAGALAQLPLHLWQLGVATASLGDLAGAASLVAESDSVAEATGSQIAPYAALRLAALRGNEAECSALIAAAVEHANTRGQGTAAIDAHWAAAVLYNGLGRYEEAKSAARQATTTAPGRSLTVRSGLWALPELVEAAARAGDDQLAGSAFERLEETTLPCGNDLALGIEARCRALLRDGAAAEELYREALDRLSRTQLRPELARAHLLYGEWLRREGRRVDAREELRAAHDMLAAIGMDAFADRARRELLATGETVRKRTVETRDDLTAQERRIALLARDGLSNPQIAGRLFVSPRTVEWHLRHVFAKLGIRSRRQLSSALSASASEVLAT
jgi:DNA-binding CsgD family transcriptional regulator/tetratricopeptide (TPR) repeat protein